MARRRDRKFLLNLLRKIGYEPTNTATANLKRVENISWIKSDKLPVLDLDDAQQHSLVQLLMASSVKRTDIFEVIEQLLLRGKPGGRRAAAVALAQFNGAEANNLAVRALDDEDPNVQAAAVAQLRARGIPGALGRLIDSVDSIHEPVRQAARSSLSEFNFDRFQAAFDMLEEDVRQSTGVLVRKVNDDYVESLKREMGARSRIRRLRSIAMTVAMRAVPDVEDGLLDMLADDDHVVRTEAAKALAFAESPTAREALQEALGDRSTSVQEAAQQSLEQLGHAPTDQDAKPLAAIAAELASHTGRIM